jgi:putative ABC transport system substrate-binding protein
LRAARQALQALGWTEGRNLRIDTRWGAGNADRFRQYAAELVALAPDALLAASGATMLKEIAPRVSRVAILRDPADPAGIGQFGALQITAPSFGIDVHPIDVREAAAIERGIAALAKGMNGGLIVTESTPAGRLGP